MRIETEMPEMAFRIGHFGIESAVVEKQDGPVRIADVVFGDAIAKRESNVRPQPLGHEANVPADRGLKRNQTLLRTQLIIEVHDLDLRAAEQSTLGVDIVGRRMQL